MSKKNGTTVVEIEDGVEDLEFDEEVETSAPQNDVVDNDVDDDNIEIDDTLQQFMNDAIDKAKKQSTAYTDKRIEKVNKTLASHKRILDTHTDEINELKSNFEELAKGNVVYAQLEDAPQEDTGVKGKAMGVVDTVFGTVGGVLHGVVDVAAFVCESTIDLVTLGKARKQ